MKDATEIGPSTAILRLRCSVSLDSSAIPRSRLTCFPATCRSAACCPAARDHDQGDADQHHGDRQDLTHGHIAAEQKAQLRVGLAEMFHYDPTDAIPDEEDPGQQSGPVSDRGA